MRILQVCNVGNICGGTAGCAWSITHALPDQEHLICFLSQPTRETQKAFSHCEIHSLPHVDAAFLRQSMPDLLLLHNTPASRIKGHETFFSIQYHHSQGDWATASKHIACSQWLADRSPFPIEVLFQPIPIPPRPVISTSRNLADELTIGRICTPITRKWPNRLISFYSDLAMQFPQVRWEFVGAPEGLKPALQEACHQRVAFHKAEFNARQYLWRWHAMLYHHPELTESFGRTVAESMRGGCVPIVDARGGFLEQVSEGETGFLCAKFDDFTSAIEAILDRSRLRQIASDAQNCAGEKFSLAAYYSGLQHLLERAAASSVL